MTSISRNYILSLILGTFTWASTGQAWTSWVGALEDWPVSKKSNEPIPSAEGQKPEEPQYEARIRPLFVRIDNNSWQAAPKTTDEKPSAPLSKAFSWDVCFGGRGEGQVTGLLDANAKDPLPPYLLRPEDRAAWRTRRSNDYSGVDPTPVYKPILLMSSLNSSCKDPEKWKQGGAEKAKGQMTSMISEIKKQFAFQSPDLPPYEFRDQDVKIYKTWAAAKKGVYVALKTRAKDPTIETLFISTQNEVTHIGRNMLLIDASDFDGDGTTELLFKRRFEKKDVYELLIGPKSVAQSVWVYP